METNKNNNLDNEKNVTISEACNRLAEIIYYFKINLIKYGMRGNKS